MDRLIDVLIQCVNFFIPWAVLNEYERGVLLRFGHFKRELGPGFHWCIPFAIDHVMVDNVVTRTHTLPPQTLTTKDGRTVSVTAVITANIGNVRKALLEVENMDHALLDACSGAVGQHVAATDWDDLRKHDANETLTKACRQNTARRYGVEIERVQLADLAVCKVIRLHGLAHAVKD
jgi:regulator of protease activity HflC (stomatin/prohibitin superfamily)